MEDCLLPKDNGTRQRTASSLDASRHCCPAARATEVTAIPPGAHAEIVRRRFEQIRNACGGLSDDFCDRLGKHATQSIPRTLLLLISVNCEQMDRTLPEYPTYSFILRSLERCRSMTSGSSSSSLVSSSRALPSARSSSSSFA